MANHCCTPTPSSLDADNNARGNIIIAKMHAVRSCYSTLSVAVTKKITIGKYCGMLNVIQHALTIANFAIDYSALPEINCKIAVMGGGGDSHLVKKNGLSLFAFCVNFWVI
jgi:hypothetical protein